MVGLLDDISVFGVRSTGVEISFAIVCDKSLKNKDLLEEGKLPVVGDDICTSGNSDGFAVSGGFFSGVGVTGPKISN